MNQNDKGPALDLIYDFAVHSYDMLIDRVNAIDRRLHTMLIFSGSILILITLLLRGGYLDFHIGWLVSVLGAFLIASLSAFWALSFEKSGEITLVSPKVLYEECYYLSERDFKLNIVGHCANDHYKKNNALVLAKWKWCKGIQVVIAIQILLIFAWVLWTATRS